ncbi:MAG: TonB family protein [Acidobacteria bacterium]|nr:TonB family protein [Acidobacteriota bacterium]
MARVGINIIIEKRKTLENGNRTFSAISILLHIVIGLIVVIGVLSARDRVLREPKIYRVSIATLATAANPNIEQNKTTAVSEKPIPKPALTPIPKPVHKTIITQKTPKKPSKKTAVGLNTTKPEKQTSSQPIPRQEDIIQPSAGSRSKRIGFGRHGSVVDLDGANFEYAYYLSIVQDRIGSNWVRAYVGKGKVKIYFRIKRNGSIVGSMIEESSGNVGLDRVALRAITASSPLPPLPEGYTGDNLGIHIWFNYEE